MSSFLGFLEEILSGHLLVSIHRCPHLVPPKVEPDSVILDRMTLNSGPMTFDELIIASACGEDIPSLAIIETLEEQTTSVEFRVKAAERTNVNLSLDVESFEIGSESQDVSEHW